MKQNWIANTLVTVFVLMSITLVVMLVMNYTVGLSHEARMVGKCIASFGIGVGIGYFLCTLIRKHNPSQKA